MTESDRAALPGLLAKLRHETGCASLKTKLIYEDEASAGCIPAGLSCDCVASKLSAGIAELLRERRGLQLPGTYSYCGRHYYAIVRGDEECPTCAEVSRLTAELAEARKPCWCCVESGAQTRRKDGTYIGCSDGCRCNPDVEIDAARQQQADPQEGE